MRNKNEKQSASLKQKGNGNAVPEKEGKGKEENNKRYDANDLKDEFGLDERKLTILRSIIDDYITTATPVGSRAIAKHSDLGLSSATIRNEMSDLEELGFLVQPHTSAGRIPSDKAYRFYVDHLMKRTAVSKKQRQFLEQRISSTVDEWHELAGQTARVLSEMTQMPSIVMTPDTEDLTIKHIQLVPVATGRALAVIVTEAATVYDMQMDIPEGFAADELEKASKLLTDCLAGTRLSESGAKVEQELVREFAQYGNYWKEWIKVLEQKQTRSARSQIALGGAATLFHYPEFNDMESARLMLAVLETEEALYHILNEALEMEVSISIGKENDISEMQGSSIITARFQLGDSQLGSFAVIGPTRMNYARVSSVVENMAQTLSLLWGK